MGKSCSMYVSQCLLASCHLLTCASQMCIRLGTHRPDDLDDLNRALFRAILSIAEDEINEDDIPPLLKGILDQHTPLSDSSSQWYQSERQSSLVCVSVDNFSPYADSMQRLAPDDSLILTDTRPAQSAVAPVPHEDEDSSSGHIEEGEEHVIASSRFQRSIIPVDKDHTAQTLFDPAIPVTVESHNPIADQLDAMHLESQVVGDEPTPEHTRQHSVDVTGATASHASQDTSARTFEQLDGGVDVHSTTATGETDAQNGSDIVRNDDVVDENMGSPVSRNEEVGGPTAAQEDVAGPVVLQQDVVPVNKDVGGPVAVSEDVGGPIDVRPDMGAAVNQLNIDDDHLMVDDGHNKQTTPLSSAANAAHHDIGGSVNLTVNEDQVMVDDAHDEQERGLSLAPERSSTPRRTSRAPSVHKNSRSSSPVHSDIDLDAQGSDDDTTAEIHDAPQAIAPRAASETAPIVVGGVDKGKDRHDSVTRDVPCPRVVQPAATDDITQQEAGDNAQLTSGG